ncbi:MAG: carboxypeptidase regulatory-like domain-containing protein [Elusimicrobiota bacterium]
MRATVSKSNLKKASTGTIELKNDYITVVVDDTGKFTVGTVEGDPTIDSDNEKDLLYGHPSPSTSETMILVDSITYTFGEDGTNTTAPALSGDTLVCAWNVAKNIVVTQTMTIVKSKGTRNDDTIEIKYTLKNNDTAAHKVALRIQLDTLLGENDGAPFRVPNIGEVTKDKEFANSTYTVTIPDIPQFVHVFDSLSNPTVFSMLTFKDIGYRTPDRLILGYWPDSYNSWDYTVDPNQSFLDYDGDGEITGSSPDSDSSAVIYWGYPYNAISLAPGESLDLAFLYGLSNMNYVAGVPFNIGLTSPSEFEASYSGSVFAYYPQPFTVTAYLLNTLNTSVNNGTITLNLPTEFYLVPGETATKYIEEVSGSRSVGALKSAQVSWSVKTFARYKGDRTFSVTSNTGYGLLTVGRMIYVPGIANAVFGQVTDKSGNPIRSATVELLQNGVLISAVSTNSDGVYIFSGLALGEYSVRITAAGYPVFTMPATVTADSSSTNPVLDSSPAEPFECFAYPTPVKEGDVRIRFYTTKNSDLTVRIFDAAGGLIKTYSVIPAAGQWQEVLWNIDDVANGVYFFSISGAGADMKGKIAVIKRKPMQ